MERRMVEHQGLVFLHLGQCSGKPLKHFSHEEPITINIPPINVESAKKLGEYIRKRVGG